MSHGYLCRQLRRYRDQTPAELLRELRVSRLRHIVQADPAVPLGRLVEDCGFMNARRLHRQLREETGHSLKEWRGRG